MSATKDEKLIRSLKKGDVSAFDEVFIRFNRKIYAFSLSYLKSREDADGVVQEVFLKLWRNRAKLKDSGSLDSYLFTIAFNHIRKHFRSLASEKNHQEQYQRTLSISDDSTINTIEYNNLLELAEAAIGDLPSRQKEVYQLSVMEGLNCEEIAGKLGISRRTVENHIHRARLTLKNSLY